MMAETASADEGGSCAEVSTAKGPGKRTANELGGSSTVVRTHLVREHFRDNKLTMIAGGFRRAGRRRWV